jgi:transcriptional antiterminator NusG
MVEANLIGEVPHVIKNIPGYFFLSLTKGGDPVPMRKSEVNRMLGKWMNFQNLLDVDSLYCGRKC